MSFRLLWRGCRVSTQHKKPLKHVVPVPNRVGHHFDALSDARFVEIMGGLCGIPSKVKGGRK